MRFSQLTILTPSHTVVLSASSGAREHGAERPRHQVHLAEDSSGSAVFCRVLFIGASSRVVDAVEYLTGLSIKSPARAAPLYPPAT
jgi:hypothetical protein